MFVKNIFYKDRVGQWTITTKYHRNRYGTMFPGTKVMIMDVKPNGGYSIQDEDGNLITNIGWGI